MVIPKEEKQEEKEEMTPDERTAWLRERGVLIETPEVRKMHAVNEAMEEADNVQLDPISYVLIPADTSQPIQELSFVPKSLIGGDALTTHLKNAFSGSRNKVDVSLLLEQRNATTMGSSETPSSVSEDTLTEVAKEGHVEVFNLVHPTPSNNCVGVNIYLDEVGMLKRLKTNSRASNYAKLAGYSPPPTFYGDVFLGRIRKLSKSNGCGSLVVENMNFDMPTDAKPNAEWIQNAATQNLEYQMEVNQITGTVGATQAAVDGSDGKVKQESGYSWTQTEEELEISIDLPSAEEVKSKQIQVKFKPKSLVVTCRTEQLLELELFEKVDVDGCTWTLDRPILVVTMEKVEQALWPRIRN